MLDDFSHRSVIHKSNEHMHVIRHDAPVDQLVGNPVSLDQMILHDLGMFRLAQKTSSMTRVLVAADPFLKLRLRFS